MESSPRFISRIFAYTLALHGSIFMVALMNMRTEMTNKNQSAFEFNENGMFFIISSVALFTAEVTSGILFFTNVPSRYYTVLKFIGISSANIAPCSLLLVSNYHYPTHKLILHLVGILIYGLVLAYVCYGNDDIDKSLNKSELAAVTTYLGLVLVPLAFVLVLFAPKSLNSIVFSVIYVSAGLEFMCVCIIHFKVMFMLMTPEKAKPQNLEAQEDQEH